MSQTSQKELAGLLTPCRTGRHFWYFPEDAAFCCRGFKQEIVFDPQEADTWLYLFSYGYKWVKKAN